MLTDDRLDATLRDLDPTGPLDDADRAHQRALLASLVDSPPALDAARSARVVAMKRARRRPVLRWAVPVAAAAAAAAVAIPMTSGSGPQGGGNAFASWTATPSPVSGTALVPLQDSCRASIRDSLGHDMSGVPEGERPAVDLDHLQTVVAERRGDFTFLAMADPRGSSAQCFFRGTEALGHTGGYLTADAPATTVAADAIEAGGAGSSGDQGGVYAFVQGRAGADVRSVTVHAGSKTLQASVSKGWFAAWWPVAAHDQPEIGKESFDIRLADGRVRTDVTGTGANRAAIGPRDIGELERGGGAGEDGSRSATFGGRAGAQVKSVVLHTDQGVVTAPVTNGAFDAQWPDADSDAPMPRIDLVLTDGTTLRDVRPAG